MESPAPVGTSTPQVLHVGLREHHRKGNRKSQNTRKTAVRLGLPKWLFLTMAISVDINVEERFFAATPMDKELQATDNYRRW